MARRPCSHAGGGPQLLLHFGASALLQKNSSARAVARSLPLRAVLQTGSAVWELGGTNLIAANLSSNPPASTFRTIIPAIEKEALTRIPLLERGPAAVPAAHDRVGAADSEPLQHDAALIRQRRGSF